VTNSDAWQAEHERIADRLRQLRTAASLTGKDLADRFGWQQSKVSRLETGQQRASAEDIEKWVEACGAAPTVAADLVDALASVQAGHRDWKRRMRRGAAAVQTGYNELVANSTVIRHFETVYVPGLLQTPEYAEHVLTEGAALAEAETPDIAAGVATRMQRQQLLYDRTKRFEFLLAEPVLRWLVCPVDVMRGQLDRLHSVIGLPNVRFGILPLGKPLSITPQNSFQLYDNVAVVETFVGEWTHREDDSAVYLRVIDKLWADALEGDSARKLIVAAIDELAGRG
jgi:transcriptional regulator with XRE-family HTH domain